MSREPAGLKLIPPIRVPPPSIRGVLTDSAAMYTVLAMSCLFCKILEGKIPSTAIYQDEFSYAFADLHPQAPVHVLIVPREHIASLTDTVGNDRPLLGHLLWAAAEIARQKGLDDGYRIVVNTGVDGGQTVEHLHLHLLGGRQLAWPPG
jgi:histidine triad (HIT) family protein